MDDYILTEESETVSDKISTGIFQMDRQLNGGFLRKSLIYFDMDADYNFKVLLHHLVNTQKVLYTTTYTPPEQIIQDIEHNGLSAEDDMFISVYDEYFSVPPSEYRPEMDVEIIEFLEAELEKFRLREGRYAQCDDDWIVIVDTLSFFLNLEHAEKYHKLHLVNKIYNLIRELGTLCYVTVLEDAQHGTNRETEILVKDLCNVVLDANVIVDSSGDIVSVLTIPKLYGVNFSRQIPPLKVQIMGGQIMVDTSQQIA